jgi:FMN phosphatase YigB (HAD superfamily)
MRSVSLYATETAVGAGFGPGSTGGSYWSKQFSGTLSNFKEVYVSSTIGLRKPEAEAYDYVVRAIGVSADRIVFFDDSLENIEGARARGLQAVHVKSGADLADALAVLIERSRAIEERLR